MPATLPPPFPPTAPPPAALRPEAAPVRSTRPPRTASASRPSPLPQSARGRLGANSDQRRNQDQGKHAVHRLTQLLVIPGLAAGIVAWGFFGVDLGVIPPPTWGNDLPASIGPGSDPNGNSGAGGALGSEPGGSPAALAESAALAAASPTATAAASPTPLPPLLTWPATPTLPATPATPVEQPGELLTPRPTRTPRPTTTATATAALGSTATAPAVAGCADPAPLPPATGPTTRATTTEVNLRRQPGLACDVLAVLPPGAEVQVRGGAVRADDRAWLPVQAAGRTGWVAADLLRDDGGS